MPPVAIVVLFLIMMSMPAQYQASRILQGEKQNLRMKNHVLGSPQAPPHVLVPPSVPNIGTHIPSSTRPQPQRKSPPPHPSMLNKADNPPSTLNPGT